MMQPERVKKILHSLRRPTIGYARKMGFACGLFGPNQQTCHWRLFCSPQHTKAWEDGKRAAEAASRKALKVLRRLGQYASDPELSFTWYDAAGIDLRVAGGPPRRERR